MKGNVKTLTLTVKNISYASCHAEVDEVDLAKQSWNAVSEFTFSLYSGIYNISSKCCLFALDGCIYALKRSLKPVAGSVNE